MGQPEDDTVDMHQAIGELLGRWAVVEKELYLLFLSLFPFTQETFDAAVIYGALRELGRKTAVVDALIKHKMSPSLSDVWSRIRKSLDAANKRRNKAAHWAIYRLGGRVIFAPHQMGPFPDDGPPPIPEDAMDASEVREAGIGLTMLARQISDFRQQVMEFRLPGSSHQIST